MSNFKALCDQLEAKIQASYEEGVTMEQAEKLAGEFLGALMKVSDELKCEDLNGRMRKAGLKAIRAAVYMDAATKGDKKPSDVMLMAIVDMNEIVQSEQKSLDEAEVNKDDLQRRFDIFTYAHHLFKSISKGQFGA